MEENKKYLQKFADDERMFEAVRAFIAELDNYKGINLELSNEYVGSEIRARVRAKELVEDGFRKIKIFRTNKELKNIINNAR